MPSLSFPQFPTRTNMPDVITVCGELVCAASPTIAGGKGFTVTKQGTGVFRVTLNKRMGRVQGMGAVGQLKKLAATVEARFLAGVLPADTTVNYVEFRVEDATGAAADPATTDRIAFQIPVMMNRLPLV